MENSQCLVRPKVLWLPSWYPHDGHPLLGNFTRRDAEAVAPYCDFVVLYPVEAAVKNFMVDWQKTEHGFTELRIYFPKSRWKTIRMFRRARAYQIGWKRLAESGFRPDLLHLHVTFPAGIGAMGLKWLLGVPLIISEHWSGFAQTKAKTGLAHRCLLHLCTRSANAVLTVTPEMADGMRRLGLRGNFIANPNVVDVENVPFRKREVAVEKFRFVHVSSLDDGHKNISGMLRTFQKLAALRQDFNLEIIGGDEGTEGFEQLVSTLGLEKIVRFKGRLPHADVMQHLADSDAFVLFSNREGLPCVLLEAMAVGLPVISTDLPGLATWIPPENGLLVPIADEAELLSALQEIMVSHQKFDGQKIRKFIVARCSYEVVGYRILRVYQEVLTSVKSSS